MLGDHQRPSERRGNPRRRGAVRVRRVGVHEVWPGAFRRTAPAAGAPSERLEHGRVIVRLACPLVGDVCPTDDREAGDGDPARRTDTLRREDVGPGRDRLGEGTCRRAALTLLLRGRAPDGDRLERRHAGLDGPGRHEGGHLVGNEGTAARVVVGGNQRATTRTRRGQDESAPDRSTVAGSMQLLAS